MSLPMLPLMYVANAYYLIMLQTIYLQILQHYTVEHTATTYVNKMVKVQA